MAVAAAPVRVSLIPEAPPAGVEYYEPRGAALALMYCQAPEILIEGPSGTGKSRAVLEKVHLLCKKYPGMRALLVRKTRESLTQSAMVTFEEKVREYPAAAPFHHEKQEYRYPNGSRLVVGGLDKDSKVMSTEFDVVLINEATELLESDWEALSTRLRNGVLPYQQIIGDCNPDGPSHWLNVRCTAGKTVRLVSRHEDNPSVTPDYIARLDALTGYRYKRLRLGLWVAAEGMYFDEWDPEVHVVKPFDIPKDWVRWMGVDYGFADPWCALWAARNPENRRIYVYREIYRSGVHAAEQARVIAAINERDGVPVRVFGDPSMWNQHKEMNRPSFAEDYEQNGVPLERATNARHVGWQAVKRAMQHKPPSPQARLQVFNTCTNLIRTIPEMVIDPLDPDDLADEIVKGGTRVKTDDHVADSLRYLCMAEAVPDAEVEQVWGGRR